MFENIMHVDLRLFDGEGAAAGTASAAETGSAAQEPDFPGVPKQTAKTGEDLSQVHYGKADPAEATQGEAAEQTQDAAAEQPSEEDLRKEFKELIKGKYKDVYAKETQRLIDRRYGAAKEAQEQLALAKPILDTIAKHKYGMENADDLAALSDAVSKDDMLLQEAAYEAGFSDVNLYRQYEAMQREHEEKVKQEQFDEQRKQQREMAEKWYAEAQALKEKYADFDLETELNDPDFMAALRAGAPMEMIYCGKYHDKLMQDAMSFTASKVQQDTVNSVRARGTRPVENGASSTKSPIITKTDPSKLTLKDFDEIARRAARGERIAF